MTTISFNRRRKWPGAGSVIAVASILIIVGMVALMRTQAANVFWRAAGPVLMWRNSLESGEVSVLKAQLASSTLALADRNLLYAENLALKRELGRPLTAHSLLAAVIMRPPGIPYDTLIIDAGAQDGVVMSDAVYAAGNTQIGTVSEVYNTAARVTLFSSPGLEYQAFLRPLVSVGAGVPLNLEGDGAGSMSAQIPETTPAQVGDAVVISGSVGGFVGTVSHIDAPQGDSFKTLYVQLPVNLFDLQYVEVGISK